MVILLILLILFLTSNLRQLIRFLLLINFILTIPFIKYKIPDFWSQIKYCVVNDSRTDRKRANPSILSRWIVKSRRSDFEGPYIDSPVTNELDENWHDTSGCYVQISMWQGYPILIVRATDKRQTFHPFVNVNFFL